MIELQAVEFGACLGLTAAVFGFAAYWYMRFWRILPVERLLAADFAKADDLKDFVLEVADFGDDGVAGQTLADAGQRTVSALHRRLPGLSLWWLVEGEGGGYASLAHRGGDPGAPSLPAYAESRLIREALSKGEIREARTGSAPSEPWLESARARGLSRMLVVPWGKAGGTRGLLVVAAAEADAAALEALRPYWEVLRHCAGTVASAIDERARLAKASESLKGGLSAALEDLNSTHTRLIQKSREMRALQEVATTLSSRTAQTQSALGAIVAIVAKAVEADMVAFLLADESTGELVTQAGAYGLETEDLLYRISLKDANSSSVRVFRSGESFMTGDAQNDPLVNAHFARLWKIHSLIVVPLELEGRSIGVIRVGSRRKDVFGREHLELVKAIAVEAAILIQTAMLNRRLSDTAEQLTSLNHMKDDFVSTVSHEFKTPLTTIMGFLTVMLEGETGMLSEQQAKFLNIAKAAAKRLAGLVADLLDISRLEGGVKMELQTHTLEPLLRASVDNHLPQAEEGGKTVTCELGKLPPVVCDERWITLAIDNLLSNAIKFTRPGGNVRVIAVDKGEFVMVTVADDGIGIPPEDRERIFEKFYRARNRTEVAAPGTGLGLAITREVITKHGGKVWFECDPGQTRFIFIIRAAGRADQVMAPET